MKTRTDDRSDRELLFYIQSPTIYNTKLRLNHSNTTSHIRKTWHCPSSPGSQYMQGLMCSTQKCMHCLDIRHTRRSTSHLPPDPSLPSLPTPNTCPAYFFVYPNILSPRYVRTQFADPAPGQRAAVLARANQRSAAAQSGPIRIKRRVVKKAFYSDEEGRSCLAGGGGGSEIKVKKGWSIDDDMIACTSIEPHSHPPTHPTHLPSPVLMFTLPCRSSCAPHTTPPLSSFSLRPALLHVVSRRRE